MKKILILALISTSVMAQEFSLEALMRSRPEQFGALLANPKKYKLQIRYTQVNRDAKNRPKFTTYNFRVGEDAYFYPASTVKFPACLLALEKLNRLKINKNTTMLTGAEYGKHTPVTHDSSSQNNLPSVEHYAKKILIVSDNDAFNRLYELIGQEAFNEELYKKGYKDLRIVHRLQVGMNPEENRRSNPIRFVGQDGKTIYEQPMLINEKNYYPTTPVKMGKGYMKGDKLVETPMDFTDKNYFSLVEQQEILKAVMFPEAVPAKKRFQLSPEDYRFLYQYLSQLPTETTFPNYDPKEYWPTYCKFLLFGSEKTAQPPTTLRSFDKVGDAYGFLLDNAYIVDFEQGIEFFLAATVYVNEDEVFNDDKYEYDSIGFPMMKNLGQLLYDYEKARPKKHRPDLSKFKVKYDK